MTATADDGAAMRRLTQVARELKTRETAITLVVLLAVALLEISDLPPIPQFQNWLFDSFQQLRPRARNSTPAVVIEIDEKSLSVFGQWPWPRTRIAELIDRIASYEPAAIGLEAFFPEPDRLSPERYADFLRERSPELAAQLRAYPSNDSILARAISQHHVVLPVAGLGEPGPQFKTFRDFPDAHAVSYSPPTLPLRRYAGALQALDEIQNSAAGRGLASVEPTKDNVLRTVPLVALIGDVPIATFTLELLRVATGLPISAAQSSDALVDVRLGSRPIAKAQANGEMWMYFGRPRSGTYLSAADVLADRVDGSALKRKVTIIAVSAVGLSPWYATPLGEQVTGGEIYAQLVEQFLNETSLYRTAHAHYWETLAFVIVGFALAIAARYFSMPVALVVLLTSTVSACLLGLFFFSKGILVDVATPVVGWQLAYASALATSLMSARKAHRKAVSMFSRFVNPHVVQELLKGDSIPWTGQSRELTIMFSDIRNFTALSERYSPDEVVKLLDAYFKRQVGVLFLHKGSLDKFIGDGLMAFWGAPLDDLQHAKHAVDCALDISEAFDSFLVDMGIQDQDLNMGIGLHTGRAIVGLVGPESRREYTAIGAAVNLASRIEGLTKIAKRRVLVSLETMEACGESFSFEYAGSFSVKGVERQVTVYEPHRKSVIAPEQ
jgi:adenylate cyclase